MINSFENNGYTVKIILVSKPEAVPVYRLHIHGQKFGLFRRSLEGLTVLQTGNTEVLFEAVPFRKHSVSVANTNCKQNTLYLLPIQTANTVRSTVSINNLKNDVNITHIGHE